MVSGGQALIGVRVPTPIEVGDVRIRRNGRDVSALFAPSTGDRGRWSVLSPGSATGSTASRHASARGGRAGKVESVQHPGDRAALLRNPTRRRSFAARMTPGSVPRPTPTAQPRRAWSTATARPTARSSRWPIQHVAPPDLAQTTTPRRGHCGLRRAGGVRRDQPLHLSLGRSWRRDGITGQGWNGRLIHSFGGGCGAGYQQGASGSGPCSTTASSRAASPSSSASLTVLGTACNDVLSAETLSRVKEHVIESLRTPPVWTLGDGGSGGSIQQHMIAQNYPGLLDGLMPAASFPDNAESKNPDCRLLQAYFGTGTGALLSDAQKASVTGLAERPAGMPFPRGRRGCDQSVGGLRRVRGPPGGDLRSADEPGRIRARCGTAW